MSDFGKKLEDLAASWRCDGCSMCFAKVTDDGLAVEEVHWPTCDRFEDERVADVVADSFGASEAIDLRAGRVVEVVGGDEL